MICSDTLPLPPTDRREILRYAGVREETAQILQLLDSCLAEAAPVLTGKVCWSVFPLTFQEDGLDLTFARTGSGSLRRVLQGCDRVLVFAATLGLGLDRLIARYSRLSPARALMLQAIGTERIEALCDAFCRTMAETLPDSPLTARFSPGYGDLSLTLQEDIFRVLDCPRKIGLTLNESLLMSPSKSVTAIVGLGSCAAAHHPAGCRSCGKTDCLYRRMS